MNNLKEFSLSNPQTKEDKLTADLMEKLDAITDLFIFNNNDNLMDSEFSAIVINGCISHTMLVVNIIYKMARDKKEFITKIKELFNSYIERIEKEMY